MSADEESFIVLDETPSMLQYSILDASLVNNESIISENSLISANKLLLSNALQIDGQTSSIDTSEQMSANCITSTANDLSRISPNENQPKSVQSTFESSQQPVSIGINGRPHPTTTLAQSFLLGAIDCDTLKNNVKSYFPSLSSSTNTEDIEKLQSLIEERNHLKNTLQKTNVTMRQQFSMVNSWHNNVKLLKDGHEEELKKFKNINDELFNQNHDLQEKVTELQQLAELSRKSLFQVEENKNTERLERERLQKEVIDLRKELSIVIASKVELEEIHQENLDKLEVELVASQKMFQTSEDEIYKLKIQNENLKMNLKQSKDLIAEYRDEIGAVQAQCEVFRNDFELERKARAEMANERDQMIADMKLLKTRNQALVDEAQSYYTETSTTSLTSLSSGSNIEPNEIMTNYTCPLCSIVYQKLSDLESHVQACLERTANQ